MQRVREIVVRKSPLTIPIRGVAAVHLSSIWFDPLSSLADNAGYVFTEGKLLRSVSRFVASRAARTRSYGDVKDLPHNFVYHQSGYPKHRTGYQP